MRKNILLLAVLSLTVAVLTGGCGKKAAVRPADNDGGSQNQGREQAQNQNQEADLAADDIDPAGAYTINELLAMNKPMKCAWKEGLIEGGEVSNIIFINGKKFYQDVTMGDIGHAFTISDGEYLYIWNDFTGAASKISLSEMEKEAKPGQDKNTAGLEQRRDFVCEKWAADNSVFVPPADKDFADITEEMDQAMGELQDNPGEVTQEICDFCQNAPTQELIDQCRKNAQCE